MKPILAVLGFVLGALAPALEAAQIDIYSDMTRSSCELSDGVDPPVVFAFYFYNGPPATGVRFKAPKPACWSGAWFAGDNTPYLRSGDSQTDWTIGFGMCSTGSLYVGKTA